MPVKLYTLPSNRSCRKAVEFFIGKNVDFVEQKMTQEPLSRDQLFEMLMYTENGVEDILSTRSKDYERLSKEGIDFEDLSLTEFHNLIVEYPRMLRSPIIVAKNTTLIGYNEDEISIFDDRSVKKETYLKMLDTIRLKEDREIRKLKRTNHVVAG